MARAFRWKEQHPANSLAISLNLRVENYTFSIDLSGQFPLKDFQNKSAFGKLAKAGKTGKWNIPTG
jgi:hypothetical protein